MSAETEVTQIFIGWHKRHDGDKGHAWLREKVRSIPVDWSDTVFIAPAERCQTTSSSAAGTRVRGRRDLSPEEAIRSR